MGSEWKQTTIGDELTLQRGFDITRKQQRPGDVPVVSSGGIASYHDTAKQTGPGVIMGRKGSLGTVFYVEQDYWPHDTTLWIKDFHGNDERFSYYFFKDFASHLLSMDVGAANPTLNRNHVHPIEISWPPLPEQKAIAHILGTLDDKIELNRRMNATLEGMAQALFKSWFVDFDPVIDNALAAGNPIPDELAPRAEVRKNALASGTTQQGSVDHPTLSHPRSLFPAAFQLNDELGWIPEGWEARRLGDVCRVINGRAYKNTEFKDSGTPIVRIQNLSGKGKTVYSDLELPDDKLIDCDDLIFAWSATFGPHIWRGPRSIYHYHIWKMDVEGSKMNKYLLYFILKRETDAMRDAATGSIFTHLTKKTMESLTVLLPSDKIIKKAAAILEPNFEAITRRIKEVTSLERLRDTLLPKLISGELHLSETEQLTEEALL